MAQALKIYPTSIVPQAARLEHVNQTPVTIPSALIETIHILSFLIVVYFMFQRSWKLAKGLKSKIYVYKTNKTIAATSKAIKSI